jgi:predicted ATPase
MSQAKSWELRAAMSLPRLWQDQGRVGQARELLFRCTGNLPSWRSWRRNGLSDERT